MATSDLGRVNSSAGEGENEGTRSGHVQPVSIRHGSAGTWAYGVRSAVAGPFPNCNGRMAWRPKRLSGLGVVVAALICAISCFCANRTGTGDFLSQF